MKQDQTPDIADLVIEDMRARKKLGMERYGVPLRPNNGRDALQDAYEEALDLAVYLKQAIEERVEWLPEKPALKHHVAGIGGICPQCGIALTEAGFAAHDCKPEHDTYTKAEVDAMFDAQTKFTMEQIWKQFDHLKK